MANIPQRSFTGGELDPALHSRTDLSKYHTGAKSLRNVIVKKSGGVANRPGTTMCISTLTDKFARFIPYVVSRTDSFVLEFTNLKIRVIKDGVTVVATIDTPYLETDLRYLKFTQTGVNLKIAHADYPPRYLTRSSFNTWDLNFLVFGSPPGRLYSVTATAGGTGGLAIYRYGVTSINQDGRESVDYNATCNANATLSPTNYVQIGWNSEAAGITYNVYKNEYGIQYLLGVVVSAAPGFNADMFRDVGQSTDKSVTKPQGQNPFDSVGNYPAFVANGQQRDWFGSTNTDPEKVWSTETGYYNSITGRGPGATVVDSDSIIFKMDGKRQNRVNDMLDVGGLVMFTDEGEVYLAGEGNGILTPRSINPKFQTHNGTDRNIFPLLVNNNALYVQSGGKIVRELGYSFEVDGYRGDDLTTFAGHLFENNLIVDWAFQKSPHSLVWAIRNDGTLISLTYVKEQQIIAWTRHDFLDGFAESIICIPEGGADSVYLTIKRTVNGVEKRYIEKLSDRFSPDIRDLKLLDCSLSYDGRNTDATKTITISTATNWDAGATLTLTASATTFTAGDVGKKFFFYNGSALYRVTVTAYTSGTVISGTSYDSTPTWAQASARSGWARAVSSVSGLAHLEGKKVSIFADGYVVASPLNSNYAERNVVGGAVTLPDHYAVIHVGLPFISDVQTLPIDTAEGESLAAESKLINEVLLRFRNSMGGFVGTSMPADNSVSGLIEIKPRTVEGLESPNKVMNEVIKHRIPAAWENNGSVLVRQIDPAPLEIGFIAPSGLISRGR